MPNHASRRTLLTAAALAAVTATGAASSASDVRSAPNGSPDGAPDDPRPSDSGPAAGRGATPTGRSCAGWWPG
ncbi:hypothetical protein ACFSNO_31780 [Streptomyces cirratus]